MKDSILRHLRYGLGKDAEHSSIYDWRMERPVTSLEQHMPDIQPLGHYAEEAR